MSGQERSQKTGAVLDSVRKRLLDLSLRNRLLNHRRGSRCIGIVDELPAFVFRRLLEADHLEFLSWEDRRSPDADDASARPKKELPTPSEDPDEHHRDRFLQTPLPQEKLEQVLKKITAESQRSLEETGTNILYLAMGFLEWFETQNPERIYRAPLILIPVNLSRIRARNSYTYRYQLTYNGEDLETNLCLAQKLSLDLGIHLPHLPEDDAIIEPEPYFTEVAEAVASRGWRVAREMVLDFFSFSKLFMYLDLDPANWPEEHNPTDHPILQDLLVGSACPVPDHERSQTDLDGDPRAASIPLVMDADSAQHQALVEALDGKSFVIEGPPGTGKSQTITNLIAALLHEGKTILFLSEKMAALEVVQRRLEHVGLGPFIFELHSNHTHKQELMNGLKQRLEYRYRKPRTARNVRPERDDARDQLNRYAGVLNRPFRETGLSVFEVFWNLERELVSAQGQASVALPDAADLSHLAIGQTTRLMAEIETHLDGTVPARNCWYGFHLANLNPINRGQLEKDLEGLSRHITELISRVEVLAQTVDAPPDTTMTAMETIARLDRNLLFRWPTPISQPLLPCLPDPRMADHLERLCRQVKEVREIRKQGATTLHGLSELSDEDGASMLGALQKAVGKGLGGTGFATVRDHFLQARRLLRQVTRIRELIGEQSWASGQALDDLETLGGLIPFLTYIDEATPIEAELVPAERIFKAGTLTVAMMARDEAAELAKKRAALEDAVHFDQETDPKVLRSMLRQIREHQPRRLRWTSKEYRTERLRMQTVLKERVKDVVEAGVLVEKLCDYLECQRRFVGYRDYRERLGSMFTAEATDWDLVICVLTWAEQIQGRAPYNTIVMALELGFGKTMAGLRELYRELKPFLEKVPQRVSDLQLLADHSGSQALRLAWSDSDTLALLVPELERVISLAGPVFERCNEQVVSPEISLESLRQTVAAERQVRAQIRRLEGREVYRQLCGGPFSVDRTDPDLLLAHLTWCRALERAGLDRPFLDWLFATDTEERIPVLADAMEDLTLRVTRLKTALAAFETYGNIDPERFFTGSLGSLTLQQLLDKVRSCLGSLGTAMNWADYCRLAQEARNLGVAPLIDAVDEGRVDSRICRSAFLYSLYESMINTILMEHPELNQLSSERHALLASIFRETDVQLQKHDIHRTVLSLMKRQPPAGVRTGPVKSRTEMGLLRRETAKIKQHIPIRCLVGRAAGALQALKPCFMMSPLSVAQYLPPGALQFDVVIMDEASQLRPEECLGSIARTKQVIVVGDPKQMPPASFFDVAGDDTDEDRDGVMDDLESILDFFVQAYGSGRRLLWHYRSCHEDLIRFSNQHFYNDELVVFPSPHGRSPEQGVSLVSVEGATFADRVNRKEAEEIAGYVLNHLRTRSNLSLGVCAFNGPQRDLIRDEVERRLRESPDLLETFEAMCAGEDPFFVKNLENIQGDERDVIFISYTYGPDPERGRVYQRFGPVNSEMGWRRLNVMFTRARRRIVLFSSIKPEDIPLKPSSTRGVIMLRRYLEYAGRPPEGRPDPVGASQPVTAFHRTVAEIITESGLDCVFNLGISGLFLDVAVFHPDRPGTWLLGIMGDGPSYGDAASARDRDRVRISTLERQGWRLHHILSVDWFKNRSREQARLETVLHQCMDQTPG